MLIYFSLKLKLYLCFYLLRIGFWKLNKLFQEKKDTTVFEGCSILTVCKTNKVFRYFGKGTSPLSQSENKVSVSWASLRGRKWSMQHSPLSLGQTCFFYYLHPTELNSAGGRRERTEIVPGLEGTLNHPETYPWDLKLLSITAAVIQLQSQDSVTQLIWRRDLLRDTSYADTFCWHCQKHLF